MEWAWLPSLTTWLLGEGCLTLFPHLTLDLEQGTCKLNLGNGQGKELPKQKQMMD